ncbi:MAG TPA: hypothetical protein VHC49_07705 [Mycobacteriales bacterium]|nr:hypothetical protein [Mycobacteriales bacterium]
MELSAQWVEFGPRDPGGDFAETMTWTELPAEGWVGDAMTQIRLPNASEAELLDAVTAWDRILSWAAGHQARAIAEFAARRRYGHTHDELSEDDLDEIARVGDQIDTDTDSSTTAELSLALTVAPITARRKLDFARDLATRLPAALDRMCAGDLTWSKAKPCPIKPRT